MIKTKKYLNISLVVIAMTAVDARAQDPTSRSPYVSPIVSPLVSPLTQPIIAPTGLRQRSATGANIYGQFGNFNNRPPNSDLSLIRSPIGYAPYNSLGNNSRQDRLASLRSLLMGTPRNSYSPQTSASLRSSGLTGLDQTQFNTLNNYNIRDIPNKTSVLDIKRQSPMEAEIYDIGISLDRDVRLMELRDQYGDIPLDQGIIKEPVRKANPDIIELLQTQETIEPQTPRLPGEIAKQQQELSYPKDGDVYDSLIDEMQREQQEQQPDEQTEKRKYTMDIPKREPLPEADHKKALEILGEHKTFESLAKANQAEYLEIANKMLVAARFYKAADACTLASVWMPEDAEPYLIKGLALFAAGEYMSASFYIQQAIELKKEYASEMIGLEEKITDIDLIDNRLVEAKQWQRQARSPEIAFLIGFIHYQQNNFISASEIIKKAVGKMGDNPAVMALQKAIEQAGG